MTQCDKTVEESWQSFWVSLGWTVGWRFHSSTQHNWEKEVCSSAHQSPVPGASLLTTSSFEFHLLASESSAQNFLLDSKWQKSNAGVQLRFRLRQSLHVRGRGSRWSSASRLADTSSALRPLVSCGSAPRMLFILWMIAEGRNQRGM